jgi:hypothetical protein
MNRRAFLRSCGLVAFGASVPYLSIVRPRVRSGKAGVHIHHSNFESIQGSGDFGSSIDWDFLPGDRIDSSLATEKELERASAPIE